MLRTLFNILQPHLGYPEILSRTNVSTKFLVEEPGFPLTLDTKIECQRSRTSGKSPASLGWPLGLGIHPQICTTFNSHSRHHFLQKGCPKASQREPKWGQKPPEGRPLDPSRHMVFILRITHWDVSGALRKRCFSTLLSERYFLQLFCDLCGCWGPNGSQNG